MNRLLDVRGLRAGYGRTVAVRDIDIHVDQGEIVAILGPNGAGKSTTLLALAGVLPRMAGEVIFDGATLVPLRAHIAARRGLALVPEKRALFTQLTVRENLRLGERSARQQNAPILQYFPELAARLDVRAGLLSGGEQQMLAVGRALLSIPRLLIIDEMSLGLAPVIVKRLLDSLRLIRDELGVSVLLVEQQVNHALTLSDRAYVLNDGAIAMAGPSSHLLRERQELNRSYFGTDNETGLSAL